MHVARHTFAVMALNSARLDVHLISRLLGHSSVTVTEKGKIVIFRIPIAKSVVLCTEMQHFHRQIHLIKEKFLIFV